MSNGWWGGNLPVGNLIVSSSLSFAISARLNYLRLRNVLRRLVRKRLIATCNDSSLRSQFSHWIEKGYSKVNVGGGSKNLDGFVNLDFVSHPGADREIVANISDLSFIPDDALSHVHSNHVLEHLTREQIVSQLHEYHRVLRRDGLLTIRVPNALGGAFGFWFEPQLEGDKREFLDAGFPADETLCSVADKWMHRDFFGVLHWFYADAGNPENEHLTLITPTWLIGMVANSGFAITKTSIPESVNLVVIAKRQ